MPEIGGVYIILGEGISLEVGRRVWAFSRLIEKTSPAWLTDWIPSYNRVYLEFDTGMIGCRGVINWARELLTKAGDIGESDLIEVPVRYGDYDLPEVAKKTGLTEEEVVRLHSGVEYRVYAVGFTPGFPFMAEVPEPIRLPRRETPRLRIPHLSVGIAGIQTGIYPQETPGGWNILGRTLVRIYDPYREKPFLLAPGDRVRFLPSDGNVPDPPETMELLNVGLQKALIVKQAGLLTLPVDKGRYGQGRYGLARSGPLDDYSYRLANLLLGNDPTAVAIEMNLAPPVFEAAADMTVSIAGYGPTTSGAPEARSFRLRKGDVLKLKPGLVGLRSYLAVPGGFSAQTFLGSSSPDLKGGIGRPLREGDILWSNNSHNVKLERSWNLLPLSTGRKVKLRLIPGPQESQEALDDLQKGSFVVEKADRMGLRLDGDKVAGGEITSEAIPIGAVQVPAGGKPMLLLADRGTIGGYAKPAVIHPSDLWRAGQLREGSEVEFVLTGGRNILCQIEL